jgi:hypothetical protein
VKRFAVIRPQITDHRPQITDHRTVGYDDSDHRSQMTGHRSQITDHRSQITDQIARSQIFALIADYDHRSLIAMTDITDDRSQITDITHYCIYCIDIYLQLRSRMTGITVHSMQITDYRSQMIGY